ncbi:MAG TPA: efflux RND transporter periplasmic adaptor subunit [Steroidobacteraceae bacterium]|nr:efflux RND transporter periplasmic adaptor subunit [Steroidobacteraceae bacterium]
MNRFLIAALAASLFALTGCGSDAPATATEVAAEENHEGAEIVSLTPEQMQRAGIEVLDAGPAPLREHLSLYGVIAPNAERMLDVSARFPGILRSVRKRVGDAVRKGDTLATVESNESLQTYAVVAPIDGVVTRRDANEGAQTGDGPLFTVSDLSTVWVELSVFPRDLAKVRTGQAVRVRSTDTGLSAEGRVVYVAPFGSANNQTLTARVALPNPDRKWPPGLYVNADVVLSQSSVPLAIRNEALQTFEGESVVFVRGGKGFEPRPVKLGRTDGEFSEVLEGLAAGDAYATRNSFILKAELGKNEAAHED